MRTFVTTILFLSACSFSASSSGLFHKGGGTGPSSGGSSGGGGGGLLGGGGSGIVSGPELWKKWSTRGVTLGITTRADLKKAGFKCGQRANSRCFKIMDKRCEPPAGHCEFKEDAFGQWFELNGAKTQLEFMTVATTESDAALVHDIRLYTNPRTVLEPESTLGKALIAKYGTPSHTLEPDKEDKVGGGTITWWDDKLTSQGPNVQADCTANRGEQCEIEIEDFQVVERERANQQKIDEDRKRANQPTTSPQL